MKQRFLEAGEIVNTHGVRGEVKILPWGDGPEFLCGFNTVYLDGKPLRLLDARPHKKMVLAALEGVDSVEAAMRLKGKVLSIDRTGVKLPKGRHFLADLMGLTVLDAATGENLGTVQDILTPPAHEVYVVRGMGKEYMIPAVDAFVKEIDLEAGHIRVALIEGMDS
ncbi:MAG: ribosome maturation factor RimM [Pseudoflavonifractor sp.]|nr:ribosome maturation factor RimM [Pseudoflavonifractor sp.]